MLIRVVFRASVFLGGWWLPVGSRRDAGSGQGFPPFPAWPGPGGCVSGARFPAGSPVPVGGRWKSPRRYGVESQLIENFLKNFLEKSLAEWEKAVLLRSCFAGAGRAREAEGTGAAGKKLFEKFLRKSLAVQKKDVLLHPQTERGGDRVGREAGDGARRKPGGDGS